MAIIFLPPQGVITLSESSFSPTGEEDGANPSADTFDITNDGGVTLDWTATKNAAWLSLDTVSGTTDGSPDSDMITVSYDTTGLEWENSPFTDTITITDAAAFNSPRTIAVDLTITEVVAPSVPDNITFLMHAADYDACNGKILEIPGSQTDFYAQGLEYMFRSVVQADKRVVITGYEGSIGYEVRVVCYEAGSLTTRSWSRSIPGSELYYYSDIAILNNGNIVVAWADYDLDDASFAILSPEGVVLQGMTSARGGSSTTYKANTSYPVFITTLEDGGFMLHWAFYSYDETAASLWNANGTNRQPATDFFGGDYENLYSATAQMPTDASPSYYSGLFPFIDAYNGYGYWYNVTDLGEEYTYEGFEYYGGFSIASVLPQWASDAKMAIIVARSGTVRGTVITDNDVYEVDDKVILSGYIMDGFMALPNNTFLLQATATPTTDNGLNYWILDASLDIVSGPTAAFTGLTGTNDDLPKGGAI